jgi:hypothetical protein
MKIRVKSIAVVVATVAISLVNNLGIGSANPSPSNALSPIIYSPIPTIPIVPTTIYGEVAVTYPKDTSYGLLQCKNFSVVLSSNVGFSDAKNLTGKLSTGKCNYSIAADLKYIGKKAILEFGNNYFQSSAGNSQSVIVPSQPMKINAKATFIDRFAGL